MATCGRSVFAMRFIRRLFERRSSLAWVLTPSLALGGAVASCASDDEGRNGGADDGGAGDAATLDDTSADASSIPDGWSRPDAAPFDGGPRSVVCTSAPCAVSLERASSSAEAYCALLDDGTVACWGANVTGELGRGSYDPPESATAKRVVGLSDVARLYPSCVTDKSGGVWCWGWGGFPAEGPEGPVWTYVSNVPLKLALPPVRSIAIGRVVGCALVEDDVLCWGDNSNGVVAPAPRTPGTLLGPQRVAVGSGVPIRELRVGAAALAVREDGVTSSWGASPTLGRISSLSPDTNPMPIPLAGISSIDLAYDSACATAGGVGYCWGNADVSLSPPFVRLVPQSVATPEPIVQIATTQSIKTIQNGDSLERPQRWCAVGASGAVYCWGYNAGGQAGDGTKNHAYEAVKVAGLPESAVEVRAFPDSTCALLSNGKVYCWGTNLYGQLGNGKMRQPSLVPQEVILP